MVPEDRRTTRKNEHGAPVGSYGNLPFGSVPESIANPSVRQKQEQENSAEKCQKKEQRGYDESKKYAEKQRKEEQKFHDDYQNVAEEREKYKKDKAQMVKFGSWSSTEVNRRATRKRWEGRKPSGCAVDADQDDGLRVY